LYSSACPCGFFGEIPAQGEWCVIAETGLVLPDSSSNVTLNSPSVVGGVNQARIADVGLEKGSPLYGAKIGYFFPRREWFGIETEAYSTQLNVTQQSQSLLFGYRAQNQPRSLSKTMMAIKTTTAIPKKYMMDSLMVMITVLSASRRSGRLQDRTSGPSTF
jgi:hypothetical protein